MMRRSLPLVIWLSSVRCQQPKVRVSAQEGGLAKISCPYDSGYETDPKYFYKGLYAHMQIVIETAAGKQGSSQNRKYYICDDTKQRVLHVTIHNVNLNDAGTYWCVIDSSWFDPKTEIELKVYKAPAPPKSPLVTSNPPVLTTVQIITGNQQQSASATVTEGASGATLRSTTPEDMHTVSSHIVSPPLLLSLAVASAVLLSLSVVLYLTLRKYKQGTGRVGCEGTPSMDTCGTLRQVETHSPDQPGELDPSVDVTSSEVTYATVVGRRGPDAHTSVHHPVAIQTQVADPGSEDVRLLYSTVHFNREGTALQPGGKIGSAAGLSELYATVQRPRQ
ncbi:CMRF35-like molecule 2 isoform X2 [Acanthopagrus latus]|uniref:CMRF35-like molecule 2 isoform X2 n=1 Tax=Acanthopagrus latus TaxID=8177 RepID=UPI00187CDFE5|nr:CMRF35-like molecule 2 isoform X2 [Acanthopagrus latus]